MDRDSLKSLWNNALLNPVGAILKEIDPEGKASPSIPSYEMKAGKIGSVPGAMIGQNAGAMVVRPLTNALPPTIPGALAKGALNLTAGYLGGVVGGGIGGGVASTIGHNIKRGKDSPLPPTIDKALPAHGEEERESPSTWEAFKGGFAEGAKDSSGPEQIIGIPFIGGRKGYNKSYKDSARELIGFQKNRRLTPQSPFELALEKSIKKLPHVIPEYNPNNVILKGKGIEDPELDIESPYRGLSTPDVTEKDIQEKYYDATGEYISQGLTQPQNSSVGSLGAGVTPLLGSKGLREKVGEVLGKIGGKVSNINNPNSLLNEVEGLKDNKYSIRDRERIDNEIMSKRYGNTMKKTQGEIMGIYRSKTDDLHDLAKNLTGGMDTYITLPDTHAYLHKLAEKNGGNRQFKEVWEAIEKEAAKTNENFSAPARAILNGEPILLSQLPNVRPYLTDLANTVPKENKGGMQSVVKVLDNEIRLDPHAQLPTQYAPAWEEWVNYYDNYVADLFTTSTLTREALDQSLRYHHPTRATEARLKFEDITGENPNLIHILDAAPDKLRTELTPDTYNGLKSLASEFRQYRLNKGYEKAEQSTVLGATSLKNIVNIWEKKSKDEAFALLKGKTPEETLQNVHNMDVWMGALKQVADSGPVNHQAFLHLGQILQGAGAVGALTQAIQKRGVGIWGSLMYYTTAFAFPYITSHILANPKFMGYAIDGLRTGMLPKVALQSYLQWGEDSGALDVLRDKYNKYKDWANKKNVPYGEGVEDFFKEDEKIAPMRSDNSYSPSLKDEEVESYLENFK